MSFSLRNRISTRWLGVATSIAVLAGFASNSLGAAKDRVYNEIKNDSPAGNNAVGIYAELKGNAHQFIG